MKTSGKIGHVLQFDWAMKMKIARAKNFFKSLLCTRVDPSAIRLREVLKNMQFFCNVVSQLKVL